MSLLWGGMKTSENSTPYTGNRGILTGGQGANGTKRDVFGLRVRGARKNKVTQVRERGGEKRWKKTMVYGQKEKKSRHCRKKTGHVESKLDGNAYRSGDEGDESLNLLNFRWAQRVS